MSASLALPVWTSFESALRDEPDEFPRALGDILEMLCEIAARLDTSVGDEEFRAFLQQVSGQTKSGKAARQLLQLDSRLSAGSASDIVQQAIEGRIERLRQWTTRDGK